MIRTLFTCPHCSQKINKVKIVLTDAEELTAKWHAVAYCCPRCDKAISVEIDPTRIKADIVSEIKKKK